MSTPSENIEKVIQTFREDTAAVNYADAMATGIAADDPGSQTPGMVAVVYQGRLFHLSIADAYTQIDPVQASITISAVIRLAYRSWSLHRESLYADANKVLEEQGRKRGTETLRNEYIDTTQQRPGN